MSGCDGSDGRTIALASAAALAGAGYVATVNSAFDTRLSALEVKARGRAPLSRRAFLDGRLDDDSVCAESVRDKRK